MSIPGKFVRTLKKALHPLRRRLGRFVVLPDQEVRRDGIFYKAGCLVASEKMEGDYLEFGVYRGESFISAFRSISLAFEHMSTPNEWNLPRDCVERRKVWERMRFFAFDSFQGLPRLVGRDRQTRDFVEGKYECSAAEFEKNLKVAGVPEERVSMVPGFYEETLNPSTIERFGLKTAAIVNIDSDLYESARLILRFIKPLLVSGTVIIFDDWYCYRGDPELGERKACREWLDAHPELCLTEYHKEGPWRNSFIVNLQDGGRVNAPSDISGSPS